MSVKLAHYQCNAHKINFHVGCWSKVAIEDKKRITLGEQSPSHRVKYIRSVQYMVVGGKYSVFAICASNNTQPNYIYFRTVTLILSITYGYCELRYFFNAIQRAHEKAFAMKCHVAGNGENALHVNNAQSNGLIYNVSSIYAFQYVQR